MNKKHILSLAAAMLMPLAMMAEGFNFSVSLTDAAGAYLAGKEVSLRLSLLADNPSGTPLYIETQKVSTSPYGVASMVMGEGSKVAGDIAAIDWSGRQVYLKVERMEGANASLVSTTRITAVPYANHAYSAGSLALTSPDGSRWNVAVDNAGQLTAQKETAPYEGPAYGTVDYIFDMKALPTITLEFSLDSWNELLSNFDKNPNNEECVHAGRANLARLTVPTAISAMCISVSVSRNTTRTTSISSPAPTASRSAGPRRIRLMCMRSTDMTLCAASASTPRHAQAIAVS